jgi:hypothetical protein
MASNIQVAITVDNKQYLAGINAANSATQSFNLIKEVLQSLFPETNMIIEDSEGEKNKSVKRKKKSTTPVVNSNE